MGKPLHLWEVLENEFKKLHGEDRLGAGYEAERNEALESAKNELTASMRQRPENEARAAEPTREEVLEETDAKPSWINAPVCKVLFRRIHEAVESKENPLLHSALCLSGGGIRSATFALGVLQGLARKGVLKDLAYLSTVSGGGYIGSWLSSWIYREKQDAALEGLSTPEKPADRVAKDQDATRNADPDPKQPFETEPATIRHLREFSNYLTPAVGLLSGDGWAVAAIVLRNLLLNWLVIVPALLFVLLVPRLARHLEIHGVANLPWVATTAATAAFLFGIYSLTALVGRRGTSQFRVLLHCIFPLVLFCILAALAWFRTASTGGHLGLPLFFWWGFLTAAIAMPVGTWLRGDLPKLAKGQDLAFLRDWAIRYGCLIGIFALAGLAACGISAKFYGVVRKAYLVQEMVDKARQAPAEPAAGKTPPAPTPPPPAPGTSAAETKPPPSTPPAWALISREEKDSRLTAWVPVESDKVKVQDWTKKFSESTSARASWDEDAARCVCYGPPVLLTLVFLASTLLTGVLSRIMLDEDREWLARASGWAFLFAVLYGALDWVVLYGPDILERLWQSSPRLLSSVGGISGLITVRGGQSEKTTVSSQEDKKPGSKNGILQLVVKFAAPIFAVVLLMLFSYLTKLLLPKVPVALRLLAQAPALKFVTGPLHHILPAWLTHELTTAPAGITDHTNLPILIVVAVALAALAVFFSYFVNINKFSLHAMYRDRLLRAYLGATNTHRAPNPFTGFDECDNLHMAHLREQRPLHVINTALNLVHGTELAWQQRLATSFTFTPFTAGSAMLGYRDSTDYAVGAQQLPITLGTAMAISGAAVSPNHGYNSSPLVAFLLTFFNARLGGWFGNPGPAGERRWPWVNWRSAAWRCAAPRWALWPLICEALGLTDSTHPYVYLSDGGHFENLGIYEMVLRRCRIIVVSDAGCDPTYTFEDLGNAVSKIRVDLGIPIEFDPDIDIRKYPGESASHKKKPGRHCAIGRIRYSQVDGPSGATKEDEKKREQRDGWLIYLKPAMCGREPMDVFHYHSAHPEFPHEPTTDQWFSESQFESYRILGLHTIERICAGGTVTGLQTFRKQVKAYLAGKHDKDDD